MASDAFKEIDVFGDSSEDMQLYKKGEAPPETANFPDLFGSPKKATPPGTAEATAEKAEDNPADAIIGETKVDAGDSQPKTGNAPPQNINCASSIRETVRPGISKRTDFELIKDRAALLVIDVQKYLSHAHADEEPFFHRSLERMCSNIPKLLDAFRTHRDTQPRGCEVIFTFLQAMTNDGRDISLDYKLSGPKLANIPKVSTSFDQLFLESIRPELNQGKGDIMIPKTSCSVFASTNIDYLLHNLHVEQLVICGQLTDQCVESVVRTAADLGYFVTLVNDACAAQSKEAEEKGFHGMDGFCRSISTDQVLAELSAQSELPMPISVEAAKNVTAARICERTQTPPSTMHHFATSDETAYTLALLHSLKAAGVVFLRYLAVDICNTIRCKALPVDHLLQRQSLNYASGLATVVTAGLPTYGDAVTEGAGLDARGVLITQPDVSTLTILPYAPKSALLLSTLHDPTKGGSMSDLCTRGMLQRVANRAEEQFGIQLCVGAEIEFCLYDLTGNPVDNSVFCNSTTLNQQEGFISDLYNQLKQQRIPVEAVHAESAPGQLEVVLTYQPDPVKLADYVVLAQETIRAVSRAHSMKALFLPKILAMQAGNGLHVHLSFNQLASSKNAFSSGGPRGLSARGQSFLEGILQHLGSLLALTLPTSNSFRRMGAGCWTGHEAHWDVEDKECSLRVCSSLDSQEWCHMEYKLNDSSANLYLSLAAILTAGLAGIRGGLKLRPPRSRTEQDSPGSTAALPSSLEESLICLEKDALLMELLGPRLSKSYVALRRAEADRASKMNLEEEFLEALSRA